MADSRSQSVTGLFRDYIAPDVTHVECTFLGGADITVDRAPAQIDTRKAVALVAYLTLEGRSSRDTLAALFWPESDDARARSSLRRTLSALRSGVGAEVVVSDRNAVDLTSDVAADVGLFRSTLDGTKLHDHAVRDVCSECLPLLDEAVRLYRGDFLAGFSLRDAPDFDDWARTTAAGLRLEVADVLERLSVGRAAVGDYRRAIDAAARWVDLDPLHEPAHRHLMLLAGWAGDRPRAIEAYRVCAAVLLEELGVGPLDETNELYEAILDDDLPPAPGLPRRVRAQVPAPVAIPNRELLGRSDEMAVLERSLQGVDEGGRVVVVVGDTWMGKTRVLEDFAAEATTQGHRVLLGRGYRAEQTLPYGVVVQLLRGAHDAGWLSSSIPDWALAEVSRLLPDIESPTPPIDGLGETRLHDAVALILLSFAADRPLVLGVDDAQWVDDGSISLLSYVTHRLSDAGMLLIVTTDRTDRDGARSRTALDSFSRDGVEVELGPLRLSDLGHLPPDVAAAAIDATGGIPLLVAEHLAGNDTSAGAVKYVADRLAALSPLASQVATTAAILDGAFDAELLHATSGRGIDEVVDAVEELLEHGVLREVPGTDGNLGFTLDAMARALDRGVSAVRRRLLHARAAGALTNRSGAGRDAASAATIAYHLLRGGRADEAAVWYARAGDLAADVYAHQEAVAAYEAALAAGGEDPSIRLRLGTVLLGASRFDGAMEAFTAAAALGDVATRAAAEHRIGDVHRRLGHFDQAEHHFRLAEVEHPKPWDLYADWSLLAHRRGDRDGSASHARRSVELAVASGDASSEARARNILGVVTDAPSEVERALSLAGHDPEIRMACLNTLAYDAARRDDTDRALALIAEALDLAGRVGDRHREAALYNHLADLHHRVGRDADAHEALAEAVRRFADIQPGGWEPEVWLLTHW